MSDKFNLLDVEKFKNAVSVGNDHCLKYVRQRSVSSEDIVLTVIIKYDCLRHLYEAKQAASTRQTSCRYVDLLNVFLATKYSAKIKEDCSGIEGRLRRTCGEVNNKFKGKNEKSYRDLQQSELKLALRADEILTISELETTVRHEKERADAALRENEVLKARCEELYNKMVEYEACNKDTNEDLAVAKAKIDSLVTENDKLHAYIEKLGHDIDFENSGKIISQVGERQQRRKMKELKTNVERALWFTKSFGLTLNSVTFSGDDDSNHSTLCFEENGTKGFHDLSEEDQDKVKSVLFLLDKFCIGDAAYHELTMCSGGEDLPRSYLIKQCKDDLNKPCHITRTPGVAPGARLDFATELESVLRKQVTAISLMKWNTKEIL